MPTPPSLRHGFAALCLAVLGVVGGAHPTAAAAELRVGLLRQDMASWWSAGREHERAWALNLELAGRSLGTLLGGELAPFAGVTLAPGAEVDRLNAGLGWQLSADRLFLRLGLGGALHNGDVDDRDDYGRRRQFGTRLLFHVPLEAGLRVTDRLSASLYYDHISNGGLDDINPGMDSLGLRLGWRF